MTTMVRNADQKILMTKYWSSKMLAILSNKVSSIWFFDKYHCEQIFYARGMQRAMFEALSTNDL